MTICDINYSEPYEKIKKETKFLTIKQLILVKIRIVTVSNWKRFSIFSKLFGGIETKALKIVCESKNNNEV